MTLTLTLSEIDHPPCWPDWRRLQVTASGCLLTNEAPSELKVWLDEEKLVEVIQARMADAHDEFEGVLLCADLTEAVDALVAKDGPPATLHDWALHFEMLAARLREAAKSPAPATPPATPRRPGSA